MGERDHHRDSTHDQHDQSADKPTTGRRRVTVPEAADLLGLTVEAIRGRIKRDTIEYERDGERVFVLVDTDKSTTGRGQSSDESSDQPHHELPDEDDPARELVEELRDRIAYLERQVEEEREARRRADTLMARLMDRVPELPAASAPEPPGARESAADPAPGIDTPPDQASPQMAARPRPRSWWRRLIGS